MQACLYAATMELQLVWSILSRQISQPEASSIFQYTTYMTMTHVNVFPFILIGNDCAGKFNHVIASFKLNSNLI